MFWFFGPGACGILVPQRGIEPTHPVSEGSLKHWLPGRSPNTAHLAGLLGTLRGVSLVSVIHPQVMMIWIT